MKIVRNLLIALALLFLALQVYRPDRNLHSEVDTWNFAEIYNVPDSVMIIIKKSCYDCHSDNTHYPWYANFQPIRFLLDRDINNGKQDLNFSEWGTYSKRKQENKIKSIVKRIEKNEMPLTIYTLIHRDAILSENDKRILTDFFRNLNVITE